jgi:hypothetical protein
MMGGDELELELVKNRNFSIYPVQEAMLIQFAKENGLSVSAALRFILKDWMRMKRSKIRAAVILGHRSLLPEELQGMPDDEILAGLATADGTMVDDGDEDVEAAEPQ